MTIQWSLIAAFLYSELAFITILLLPFISPKVWQYIFQSRFCRNVAAKANMYFTIFIIVLMLFFLDSIREMVKYSNYKHSKDYEAELQNSMKLFRSQRNYYIAGFAVFLCLVIRRLVMLILTEADLLLENETAMIRAQKATETFQKLTKEKNERDKLQLNSVKSDKHLEEIKFLQEELEAAKRNLSSTKEAFRNAKDQSDNTSQEYKQLLEKVKNLQESTVIPSDEE